MPAIILHYGPYEAHGVIKHRTQRLHGLLTCLTAKQYEVEIVPSQYVNRLAIEMQGSIIFQCDIRNLLFNMECEDDIICQRLIAAIEEAACRLYSGHNVPTFVSFQAGKRYRESKNLTTKDYFSSNISLLYEHQVHYRTDRIKPLDIVNKQEEHVLSLQNVYSDYGEEDEYFCVYDEYADWDFAHAIIKGILESLPEETIIQEVIDEEVVSFGKPFRFL